MKPTLSSLAARTAMAFIAATLPATASLVTGSFAAVGGADPAFDLGALGTLDWAYWDSGAGSGASAPANAKAGGTLIGDLGAVGGGSLRGTTSNTKPVTDFAYSDGTSPVSGTATNPTGLFNTQLNTAGAGLSLQITLPGTGSYSVSLFVASYLADGVLTASLPGGADFVDSSLAGPNPPGGKYSGIYTLAVSPDNPGDVLTLTLVSTTSTLGNSHVLVSGAAVSEAPDPFLSQDTANADPDLQFGLLLLGPGDPVETPPRTVRFDNIGVSRDIGISAVSIAADTSGSFAISDIAKNGAGGQTPPFRLDPGDYVEITVQGTPTRTGGTTLTATLEITTDQPGQDQGLPISARFFAGGDLLNDNPLFEVAGDDPYANLWSATHVRVSPGLANGSNHMVRVVGVGDPGLQGEVGQANQSAGIMNDAADFESVFYFAPLDPSEFPGYTGSAGSPEGEFTDRSMQYLILADDNDVRDGQTIDAGTGQTGNIIINLAYMPDGIIIDGTPGFYVYNAATPGWELALAVDLPGSVDSNNDGVLDPAAGDTVNAYRVSVKGTGFGQPGASYSVSVSSPTNGNIPGTLSSAPLTAWHGTSGETGTLAAHSFTTADSSESNGGGFCPPFWLDEAALYYIAQPDPELTVVSTPGLILVDGDLATTGTAQVVIRNNGGSNDLSVSALDLGDPSFSITPAPGLPVVVAPGAIETLDVVWNPGASAPDTAAVSALSISSNYSGPPPVIPLQAGVYSGSQLNPNWDFEVPGADPAGDSDTFAFWIEGTAVSDLAPGLLAGSDTAALQGPGTDMRAQLGRRADAWLIDSVFAVRDTTNRAFNIKVKQELDNSPEVNIRYELGVWSVFDTPANAWVDIIDMSATPLTTSSEGDITPYRLRMTGAGWLAGTPTFQLRIYDAAGTELAASAPDLALFRLGPPTRGAGFLELSSSNGSSPGFWVDDSRVSVVEPGTGVVITGVSGGPGAFTIHYDAAGAAVNIERAGGGLIFSDIATGESSGTFTDNAAPAGNAFYRVYIP